MWGYMNELAIESKKNLDTSKSLQEVFAAIAHQWRAPLSQINSIVGSIDNRLYEQKIDDPFIINQLLQIETITKQMSQSIDDYRGYFSKKNEKHTLKTLLLKSLEYELADLKKVSISFEFRVDDTIEFIGDEQLLKQILVTLVENAKDALLERNIYMPKITLSALEEENILFIKVCDNAGGMSKSIMSKIFEPSFTTKHSSEGTGLGLFMVKKLLDEKLAASIDVKNVADGACFTLTIPRNAKYE